LTPVQFFFQRFSLNRGDGSARDMLEKHLSAVMTKDSRLLKSTILIDGAFKLILPDGSSLETAHDFYHMLVNWFKEENWSMKMKIANFCELGNLLHAVVVADYREPERKGNPYFHKMWISYMLENVAGRWYVVHDDASTAEKSE
jgi:hypothetical protein